MGRLPESFGGRKITYRIPYTMQVLMTVPGAQRGVTAVMSHQIDKPFEIHRLIPRVFSEDGGIDTLAYQIILDLVDITRDQPLTVGSPLLATLTKGDVENSWEFGEPFYLERSEGLQATLSSLGAGGSTAYVTLLLEGHLLITSPASDRRG